MRYIIDEDIIVKSPLSLSEMLTLLLIVHNVDVMSTLSDLESRNYIICDARGVHVASECERVLADILLRAEKIDHNGKLEDIAGRLVKIFPEGIKPNTKLTWRCSVKECAMRLREFFKMFGNYSHDRIEAAARMYVDSFSDDRTLMRTLKHFIWKAENKNGIPEYTSDLATWIENGSEAKTPKQNKQLITL